MLSAHNSDMREEVFMNLRTGELYVYVGKLEVFLAKDWRAAIGRVRLNFLIRHGILKSLGKL